MAKAKSPRFFRYCGGRRRHITFHVLCLSCQSSKTNVAGVSLDRVYIVRSSRISLDNTFFEMLVVTSLAIILLYLSRRSLSLVESRRWDAVRDLLCPSGRWVQKWGQLGCVLQKESDLLNPLGQWAHQLDWDLPKQPDDTRYIPSVSQATVHLLLEKLHELCWEYYVRTAKPDLTRAGTTASHRGHS